MAIVFDIETIPQQEPLTELQEKTLSTKVDKELKYLYPEIPIASLTPEVIAETRRKTMAVTPYYGQIVCIGLYNTETDKAVAACSGDEKKILKAFWTQIAQENWFWSFNGMDFDVPYILFRSAHHNVVPPLVRGKSHPFLDRKRYNLKPHYDLYKWISDWGNSRNTATLESVAEFLGIESPKDGEVVAATVEKFFLAGKLKLIEDYCLRDVKATHLACERWLNYVTKPNY